MKAVVKKFIDDVTEDEILAEDIRNEEDKVLLAANTRLTQKHLEFLKNTRTESVAILTRIATSPEEISQYKAECKLLLQNKFKYFKPGKKKDALIKLFYTYKMSVYNE